MVHHLASLPTPPRCSLVFTDSLDSVAVFNSLAASQTLHNGVLLAVARVILESSIDLRVQHVIGKETFVQIFYLTFSSMNIDNFSLKTVSTFLLHLESFCRHDGRRAFKFVGQAWFTKKGSSTIQSHGD